MLKKRSKSTLRSAPSRLAECEPPTTPAMCRTGNRWPARSTKSAQLDGPIDGVLHGAGYGKDMRFDRKQRDKVEQCIRAKTDGAAALMELTAGDPLRWFAAFGSISGRFGANGHTDYSLANDMLAKQVSWFRRQRPKCAAVAFHWHAWGDVGMATKPETKLALELIGMQFMPAREGLEHLIAELEAGTPEGEVLITDDRYYRLFFHAETLARAGGPAQAAPALIAEVDVRRKAHRIAANVPLDPTKEPFLLDHRLGGRQLLPVAVSLELLAEAALLVSEGNRTAEFRNVDIVNGFKFHTDDPRLVHVTADALHGAMARCRLSADVLTRDGQLVAPDRALLTGDVMFREASAASRGEAPGDDLWRQAPDTGWTRVAYPEAEAMFFVGPSLRCLRRIRVEPNRIWGKIIAPALVELAGPKRRVEGWQVPSALVDACLHAVGTLAAIQHAPGMSLPRYFERLALGSLPQPGEMCLARATLRATAGNEATYDFHVVGGDGRHAARSEWISRRADRGLGDHVPQFHPTSASRSAGLVPRAGALRARVGDIVRARLDPGGDARRFGAPRRFPHHGSPWSAGASAQCGGRIARVFECVAHRHCLLTSQERGNSPRRAANTTAGNTMPRAAPPRFRSRRTLFLSNAMPWVCPSTASSPAANWCLSRSIRKRRRLSARSALGAISAPNASAPAGDAIGNGRPTMRPTGKYRSRTRSRRIMCRQSINAHSATILAKAAPRTRLSPAALPTRPICPSAPTIGSTSGFNSSRAVCFADSESSPRGAMCKRMPFPTCCFRLPTRSAFAMP